jgi:hypothetical protein
MPNSEQTRKSLGSDRIREQANPNEHPIRKSLSYQQIYNSGIDHNHMVDRDPARQRIQALLQRATDQGNRFVSGSLHGSAETGFATSHGGPAQDVDLMEGFQLHLQQHEVQQRQQHEALLQQQQAALFQQQHEAPVAHYHNEQNMRQNQQEETLSIEDNLTDPDSDHESGQSSRSATLGHKKKRDEAHLAEQHEALPRSRPQADYQEPGEASAENHDADHQPHNRPQESSHSLAHRFVQSVQKKTRLQGLNLTDEQYKEVLQYLGKMKEGGEIDHDTCKKAKRKAYNSSDNGKESQKLYNSSDKAKEIRKCYTSSDKGKEALKRYKSSDNGKEVQKRYKSSDKGKEVQKRYDSSDKAKGTRKRYNSSDNGKEARKRYFSSDKGKEALKRYNSSDNGKEAKKRYENKLKDPSSNQQRLQNKIDRDTRNYRQAMHALEQQLRQHSSACSQETPELQRLLAQKQQLEKQWITLQQRNRDALQKAEALVKIYARMNALVEASQSVSHQQELEEASYDEALENHESFQQFCMEGQALLQSVSHQPEHAPLDSSAALPSNWERLVSGYQKLEDQLEVYLAEFADPESLERANTLDF